MPRLFSFPPITTVGSMPPAASTVATIEVVVVLPWAPAMATPYLSRMSSASISARGMTGTCFSRAAITSTLSFFTADEITTTCGVVMFSARWPMKISPPRLPEPLRGVRLLQVRSRDLVPEVQEHLGDAAHADAADADEMDMLNFFEHSPCRSSRFPPPPCFPSADVRRMRRPLDARIS